MWSGGSSSTTSATRCDECIVGVAAIAHTHTTSRARDRVAAGEFIEVHVDASVDLAESRDPKGLYAKAKAGGVANFTGADSAFEEPESPDLRIETEGCTAAESLETLYRFVRPRLLPA